MESIYCQKEGSAPKLKRTFVIYLVEILESSNHRDAEYRTRKTVIEHYDISKLSSLRPSISLRLRLLLFSLLM